MGEDFTEFERLNAKLDYVLNWTLRGGSDPEDSGDTKRAVEGLGQILRELIAIVSRQP